MSKVGGFVSRDWDEFVKKLQALVEKDPDRNEAETKSKLVEPVLREMGWDFFGDEVELEYPVSFATSTSKVDYALKQNERPVVFVEAKALRGDITRGNVKQALDYSTHEDVRWCVVTNGMEWRIFDADRYKDERPEMEPRNSRVEKLRLKDFADRKESLQIISRDSIESGNTAKRVKSVWQTRTTIENFESEKESVKEKITEVLKEQSGDLLEEKLESLAGQFVNDVINELESFVQEEEQKDTGEKVEETRKLYEVDPEQIGYKGDEDLSHTKIEQAFFGEEAGISNWNALVHSAAKQAVASGKADGVLELIPNAQEQEGETPDDNSNRYMVEGTNISIILMSANYCAIYSHKLAKEMSASFRVEFQWYDKENALNPGEKGIIQFEPERN